MKNLIPQVDNMTSANGNKIANQFIITTDKGTFFKSYSTIIAAKIGDKTYLDSEKWDYSQTTGKYRNQFLGLNKKETQELIKSGSIELTDLN